MPPPPEIPPVAPERRLISIRRLVPPERRDAYDAAWGTLHTAATERGAHAWRFRSADVENVFLEFIEFGAESDVRAAPAVLAGIQGLHRDFGDVYPADDHRGMDRDPHRRWHILSADRARLAALLVERSVRLGDFVLASGAPSAYYVDCRTTATHAEGQHLVGTLGLAAIRAAGLAPAAVGGLTMGADPVAYAIAHASWHRGPPVHAFSVRKEPKAHGTGKRVEGSFQSGDAVVIIEDVVTTGDSALNARAAVEAEGGRVLAVLTLVDRESGGREKIEAAGCRLLTIFRVGELLALAGHG